MEYGINVKYFEKSIGLKKASQLVAKAGFTKIDYTPRFSRTAGERRWGKP